MEYAVRKIPASVGKAFVVAHHYSRGIHNGPMCYGLFDGEALVGVCAFATPCSENVRASIYGPDRKHEVTELHRLALVPGLPKNSASYFIVRALAALQQDKPHITAVISFADSTQGHKGGIYQATNALYCGQSSAAWFYEDGDGRLRHPRQNGVNIKRDEAEARGWRRVKREGKHRYLFLLGRDKREKRALRAALLLTPGAYPKEA